MPHDFENRLSSALKPESKGMRIRHDISDLSTLEVLDTSTVLNSLKSRFQEGLYYTYIGDILVAINPCQPVNLYENHDHERYKNLYERRRETPHIYWVADELYRNLRDSGDDQCVIVSGESGAGKTESIKHILNHVIRLGPNNVGDLVQQLDQVNPLLELFGNATTPLNKNSSRFCKFIELQYVGDGQLQNGQIQFFILEKSRLIQRHQNEKNFHIFYALLGGLDPVIKSQFSLEDVADYRILVGEDEAAPVFNNQEDYREFINKFEALEIALQKIGFKDEEIANIYSVLSAILNLTNITFDYSEDETKLDFIDPSQIECVAHLLSIHNIESLESSLLFTKLSVDDIKKPKTLAEANEGRDALAKELYYRLFSCIIDKINSKLRESVTNSPTFQTRRLPTINLLDISGFENLSVNGFEQLLINTANEVLHQIFLKHVMKSEQEEYEKEGVVWKEISFTDNTDVIDLITKCHKESTTSIFHILEDEASISPGTDMTLVRKLNKNFTGNKYYRDKTETDLLFGIVHYADTVMYSADGFREKTKDTLSRCLKNVIQESKNPLLIRYSSIGNSSRIGGQRESFRTKDAGIKRNESVTKQFRTSLRQLQTKLNQSNLMFVRCLKPNAHLKPNKFDNRCMSAQLKACGLAEAASIRKEGYPVRLNFSAFASRYENISEPNFNFTDSYEKCKHIIHVSGIDKYHIGKTKVLLNYKEKEVLERLKKQHEKIISVPPSGRSSFSSNCRFQDSGRNSNIISKANIRREMHNLEVPHSVFIPKKEEISENKDSPFQEMDESKIPAYDAFRETERDIDEDNDFFTKLLKVFRFMFYIFTICGILISAVSNRIGLLLLAGSNQPTEKAKLFISLGIPMLFSWGSNAMKCAFRGKVKPSWKSYIFIGLMEIFRTIANCVLVFLLLPHLGMFRGLILIYGLSQVPAFLLLLETFFTNHEKSMLYLQRALYFLVFILQIGIIPAYLSTNFLFWTEKGESGNKNDLEVYRWLIPLIIIVISLSLWENYALFDIKISGYSIPLNHWRKRMMKVRESTNFFIEPIKIIIFWVLSWKMSDYNLKQCWEIYKNTVNDPIEHLRNFGIMYLEIVSGLICTYLAGMACKLHMQKFGFALPMIFVTPISIVLSFLLCHKEWIPKDTFTVTFHCCKLDFANELITPVIIIVIIWLTTMVIVAHIWYPESERMALFSKLFVPQFDPLLLDLSLLLRRRQDHKENKENEKNEVKVDNESSNENSRPKLLVCATTWHETRQEMVQLLKSLFRLDKQQIVSKISKQIAAKNQWEKKENDSYDLEIHIIFDDAWEIDEVSKQEIPNGFVKEFVSLIPEAVMSVAKGYVQLGAIKKVTTPYGGRLEIKMPGSTPMIIHLKNKEKIRHRKRWSQVMYLYYLLGFKTFGDKKSVEDLIPKKQSKSAKVRSTVSILNHLPTEEYKKIENTFLLTLDGDVDFKPDSVKLLIDRMLKNKKVGAVCGRIHPIGSGPMIWYQQFEYAVGHWLQKAAEHVFGCVLCCPGCFSLFRASAVMDDNVMRAYTKKPIVARDFIQYEQGEDRWLCTLLLQQGYKIDYCAGADAYTFAPENFHDFYIQRRRWAPSTIANIMDLLSTWRTTVYLNDNISVFFMFYQFILMTSSVLAPATVVLMIAGSYNAVLKISMWESFLVSLAPVILYIVVCMVTKTSTQIYVAAFMTSIYSVVMVIVTVGTIINILHDELFAPNVVFLVGLAIVFSVCGLLHPREIVCLIHGILYFLTVPSSFIFLTVYFLCNLNIVSWGTREVVKKLTPEEQEEAKRIEEEKKKKKKQKSFFNVIGIVPLFEEIRNMLYDFLGKKRLPDPNAQSEADVEIQNPTPKKTIIKPLIRIESKNAVKHKADPYYWTTQPCFGNGYAESIDENEERFWNYILKKYLHPLQENKEEKERIKTDLEMTRNNVVFGYFLLNLLWSVAVMQLQTMKDEMLTFFIVGKYEPISVMFLSVFGVVLFLQFVGMCMHRWGTFLHLMSTTHLMSNDSDRKQRAENMIKKMATASTTIDIEPDYTSSENDSASEEINEMLLPPADYDSDSGLPKESSTYEQFYKDRIKTFKLHNTCRNRHKKTRKNNPNHILHM